MPRLSRIRIGTSGWHYPRGEDRWSGVFYPPGVPDELAYYAARFDTVEINTTFYRPAPPAATRAWAARTPDGFVFAVKLYRGFTHPDAGRPAGRPPAARADVERFLEGLAPLVEAGKLGALLAQFPPSFTRSAANLEALEALLAAVGDLPVVVELRHRSWSEGEAADATEELLLKYRAGWVQIDEPKFASSIRQPLRVRGGIGYFRLHGRNARMWWRKDAGGRRYDYLYSDEELAPLARAVADTSDRAEQTFVYFNNHFRAQAVANALMFKEQLGLPVGGPYEPSLVEAFPVLAGRVPVAASGQPRLV
ncbi:MAG TPA: DUF72 domain-containing protein [Thermodesulfobacteriota bacterium]|nr:DUF72 domain-containing protein [Thermodesulfobacteriota bacterium]